MIRAIPLFASLFLLIASVAMARDSFTGKAVHVADGDTITVLDHRQQIRVSLYGIDAPETRQAFGSRAKEDMIRMVAGHQVKVRVMDVDRYGRRWGLSNARASMSTSP